MIIIFKSVNSFIYNFSNRSNCGISLTLTAIIDCIVCLLVVTLTVKLFTRLIFLFLLWNKLSTSYQNASIWVMFQLCHLTVLVMSINNILKIHLPKSYGLALSVRPSVGSFTSVCSNRGVWSAFSIFYHLPIMQVFREEKICSAMWKKNYLRFKFCVD